MWHKRMNTDSTQPSRIEKTGQVVYIRRNFILIDESVSEDEEIIPAHYEWEEMEISRDMWTVCSKFIGHDEALDDVYAALTELAEIITEG